MRLCWKRRGLLITFSGVDGSGKSKHARSLFGYLSDEGYSCSYAWGGVRFVLSYFFYVSTWLLGYWDKTQIEGRYDIDPIALAPKRLRKVLINLLKIFLFLDIQIKTSATIRVPLLFDRIVICDRYVYDLVAGSTTIPDLFTNRFRSILFGTVPTPQLSILTDVSINVLSERRNIPENVLNCKREAYLNLVPFSSFLVLDTSEDFETNQKKVRQISFLCLKREEES